MKVMNKDEFMSNKRLWLRKLKNQVFIYPTDTIYGVGCDAGNRELVSRIRGLKNRFNMPFSVIAPSKEWIIDNCVIDEKTEEWIKKLPGPYTLILKLKNEEVVARNVNLGSGMLGVRMPDNWFLQMVSEIGFPIVTTSANVSGRDFMISVDELDPDIERGVDLVIDDGPIVGHPSTLVFLDKNDVSFKKRG